jgi:hypothetical protein
MPVSKARVISYLFHYLLVLLLHPLRLFIQMFGVLPKPQSVVIDFM